MKFQNYCNEIDDEQKIIAEESLLFTYTNTKNEAFSISPENIKLFLTFILSNFDIVHDAWELVPTRKDEINKYEEKSYRQIYKSADTEELKTISSAGRSQTKALTKLISKLVSYLTASEYVTPEVNTFFTPDDISKALRNWDDLYSKGTLVNRQNIHNTRIKFYNWMIRKNLSERTAKSYSGPGISYTDKYIESIGFKQSSLYLCSESEVLEAIDLLKSNAEWLASDTSGNSMYSSACRKFAEFLKEQNNVSVLPKPFLLLAGISGTGKTRFVREQAELTGSLADTYCLTSVRPDWHEPSDLLGYVSRLSGSAEFVVTDVLKFIAKAWREILDKGISLSVNEKLLCLQGGVSDIDAIKPYWLCLDEMNLAPVEQYFADYLSVIETRRWAWDEGDFQYSCDPLLKATTIQSIDNIEKLREELGFTDANYDDAWQHICEYGLSIPFNLIVAGTVNMDETTHGFSRKVIDRALSFDFGDFFPNDFDNFFAPTTTNKALSYPIYSDARTSADKLPKIDIDGRKSIAFINAINNVLAHTPFKLAYRALNELLLAVISSEPEEEIDLKAVWDDFLMCKVLPRIEGDTEKLAAIGSVDISILKQLEEILESEFGSFWNELPGSDKARPDLYRENVDGDKLIHIACRSKEKINWMENRLATFGFTSFWP